MVQVQATAGFYHDNNLFRLPSVSDAVVENVFGIDPKNNSDTARILGIGLKLDKLISRQRLVADINVNETRYDKNTDLNFTGGDGRTAWLWQLGNDWSGEASYQRRRQLGGFEDFRRDVQDLIDTDIYSLTGGYQFHPRWRVSADVSKQDSEHSAAVRRTLDYDSETVGAELRYRTPALNFIGVQA
ncbi:MAG: hypothetical protein EHM59_17760, partial [Betaproteobacteria bacterium]